MALSAATNSSNSASNLFNSGSSTSAGRQVIASLSPNTFACSSALTGAAVAPYSPFNTPAVSLVMDL